jgi:hypothetical protein
MGFTEAGDTKGSKRHFINNHVRFNVKYHKVLRPPPPVP